MVTKNVLQKLLDLAGQFVVDQKGKWNHAEWEGFLEKAGKLGIALNDETKRNLGNILEASKSFIGMKPIVEPKAPASATGPAKPKTKPRF